MCSDHKRYKALRPPKRTVNYPYGCAQCWCFFYEQEKSRVKKRCYPK